MQTKLSLKLLCVPLMGFMLSGCGGSSGSSTLQNSVDGAKSSSSAASSAFNGNTSASSVSSIDTTSLSNIGYGTADKFVAGAIGLSISSNNLAAGGTTQLTVDAVSATGTLVTQNISVKFNSTCVASGDSILSSATVATDTGEASTTYTSKSCVGADSVNATVSYNGKVYTAQTTINIAADTVQSITALAPVPSLISLKGTGGNETSLVKFQILGATGSPVKGVDVNFSLDTNVGGIALTTTSSKSDSQGYAATTVQAGTIATAVRVKAIVLLNGTPSPISTQSSQLLVSTGIPDQKSMSLSTSLFSPTGWDYDGATASLRISLADAFSNFAPEGTTVSFRAEGGSIDSGCNTDATGTCSVKWVSSNPRPQRAEADTSFERLLCWTLLTNERYDECQAKRAGRVTILATAIGNESFMDQNGDGYYSKANNDIFNTFQLGAPSTPTSYSDEPIGLDKNGNTNLFSGYKVLHPGSVGISGVTVKDSANNVLKPGADYDVDFVQNTIWTGPLLDYTHWSESLKVSYTVTSSAIDPILNKGGCDANEPISSADVPTGSPKMPCDDLGEAYLDSNENKVRDPNEPFIDFNNDGQYTKSDGVYNGALCNSTDSTNCTKNKVTIRREIVIVMSCSKPLLNNKGQMPNQPDGITLGLQQSAVITMTLADCNGNSMPAGTTLTITSAATDASVDIGLKGALADGTDPSQFSVFVKSTSATKLAGGSFYITVNAPTPKGTFSTPVASININ